MNLQCLLSQYNFQTKKNLGQNFLKNEKILQLIAKSGEITENDTILEIGPGLGVLTNLLCQKAGKVIAIEKDRKLLPILRECLSKYDNLSLIEGDALEFKTQNLPTSNYKIIANIPYYITSPLINHFLKNQFVKPKSLNLPPKLFVLLTQKEVAQKICPQDGKLNVLAINVQTFGTPQIIATVPASDFIPTPKVDSAILKITVHPKPKVPLELIDIYFQLIHAGFHQKRKTILNSLKNSLRSVPDPKPIHQLKSEEIEKLLTSCQIDPSRRAETLTINDWNTLAKTFQD